jgi:uncharacterized protein (DUF1697 family)
MVFARTRAYPPGVAQVWVALLRAPAVRRSLASSHPFGADASGTHVAFPAGRLRRPQRDILTRLAEGREPLAFVGGEIAVRYAGGFHRAWFTPARMEREIGLPVTARNWRTVTSLAELAG